MLRGTCVCGMNFASFVAFGQIVVTCNLSF